MTPIRVQRKRTKGYRLPPGTIYVGRPSRWGNPYRVSKQIGIKDAIAYYREWAKKFNEVEFDMLRGHDLACWCPLLDRDGQRFSCHADLLLELANKETP